MFTYIVRRIVHSVFVLLGTTLLIFIILFVSGDPAKVIAPPDASDEQIAQIRRDYGFDRPIYIQYADFVWRAAHGDFGLSIQQHLPAMQLVLDRLGNSALLTLSALVFALLVAVPSGLITALRRDGVIDLVVSFFTLLLQAAPTFWVGIMLIIVFAQNLRWFPVAGLRGPQSLVLPAITLGAFTAAIVARLLRSALLDVLSSDYIRTAKAKGLNVRAVLFGHALKNAALPVITVIGLQMGVLMGGAIITEQVFGYPGLGRLALLAIQQRDIPLVQAFVVVIATIILAVNLVVDILYTFIDPRIRYS